MLVRARGEVVSDGSRRYARGDRRRSRSRSALTHARHRASWTAKRRRWIVLVVGVLVPTAGCAGDPYSRYGAVVHDDVDGAMVAAFGMTARVNRTVVHNKIPNDSFAVVAIIVRRAARRVGNKATHFAAVTPPADLVEPHAVLSGQLATLAHALDAMASTFQHCADAYVAGDSTGHACEADLAELSSRFGYVGEDLRAVRHRVQRLLLPHGVLLPPMTSLRRRVPPAFVDATARRTG